jgi:putative membrane protein
MAALFAGLIAGSVVVAWRLLTVRDAKRIAILVGVAVVVFVLLGLREGTSEDTVGQIADPALWAFFLAGSIAIVAMILPGISGSFLLVLLGMYGPVLAAVTGADFLSLGVFVVGAVIGLAAFSQLLYRALRTHYNSLIAALIGLMLGSMRVLWPWPSGVDSTALGVPDEGVPAAVALALGAFAVVLATDAIARRVGNRTVDDEIDELQAS